ncbi:MAG: hypothetical protein R2911_22830 [Caldilineaceae bacterium]
MGPQDLAGEAQDAVEQGYIFHKRWARPWICVYEQVEAVSAVTPPHYRLDLDWNSMLLNAGTAARFAEVGYLRTGVDLRGADYAARRGGAARAAAQGGGNHRLTQLPHFPIWRSTGRGLRWLCTGRRRGQCCVRARWPLSLRSPSGCSSWVWIATALSAHLGAVLPFAQWPTITCLNNYSDSLLTKPLTIRYGYLAGAEAS